MVRIPGIEKKGRGRNYQPAPKRSTLYSEKRKSKNKTVIFVVECLITLNEAIAHEYLGKTMNMPRNKKYDSIYQKKLQTSSHVKLVLDILHSRGFCLYLKHNGKKVVPNDRLMKNIKIFGFYRACEIEIDIFYKAPSEPPVFSAWSIL